MLIAVTTAAGQRMMIDEHDIADVGEILGEVDPATELPRMWTEITRYSVSGKLVVKDSMPLIERQYRAEGEAMRSTLRQLTDAVARMAATATAPESESQSPR